MKRYYVSLVYCNKSGCGIASLDKAFEELEPAKEQYQEYYDLAKKEVNGKPFVDFNYFELNLYSIESGCIEDIAFEVIKK